MSAEPIAVLDADPDLAAGLDLSEREKASAQCLARQLSVPRGNWAPPAGNELANGFGLLVLSGYLVRSVDRGGRSGSELLGPGDLLRPWQTIGAFASQPFEPSWRTIVPSRLAVLDREFVARAARFSRVSVALVDRAMLRSRHLAIALAIVQQPRVDRRLRMLLWQLADRWGRTTRSGVKVEIPLTHSLLGELVAAQRPTVTTALRHLSEEGRVRRERASWVLLGGPPREFVDLTNAVHSG